MKKQNTSSQHRLTQLVHRLAGAHKRLFAASMAVVIVAGGGISFSIVRAQSLQDIQSQINGLQSQNNASQNAVSQLQVQANNYQDAIQRLAAQIASVSNSIAANRAKQVTIQKQIDADQVKLDQQRSVLGADIKAMYIDGDMSTVEMLATSKNLSDYVDAQTYRSAVQAQVQATLKEIAQLQNALQDQKSQIDDLIADQKSQQDQLNGDKAQQNQLLAMTQAQQADYNNKIKATNGQIAKLKQDQAAIIAAMFANNGSRIIAGNNGDDTYPNAWRNAAQDTVVDSWGMYNRECVSYTAWKVAASGPHIPYWGGVGNAKQWDDNARAAGIPVDTNPRAGDVAIKNAGEYGHAMYVERVFGDGSIYVSQYNAQLNGTYSEAIISAAAVRDNNLQFIHF